MTTAGRSQIRWFRNTAPYINAHRGKTFVLMLGGEVARCENFSNIIHDIALLNSLGVKLVLIHGSRPQIAERLERAGLVSAHVGEPTRERGGRRRKHYRIRTDGARLLQEARERMHRMEDGMDVHLIRLAGVEGDLT